MEVFVFDKNSAEKLDYTFDFTTALAAIDVTAKIEGSPTITILPATGLTLVSTTVNTPTSTQVTVVLDAGVDLADYTISCEVNVTGSPDRDFKQTLYLQIRDYPATSDNDFYVTPGSLAAKLNITTNEDQTFLIDCARQATDMVKRICGRAFEKGTFTEKVQGTGRQWMLLPVYPIDTITSISFDGETVPAADYELYDAKSGILYKNDGWESYAANAGKRYTIVYTGGYITPGKSGRTFPYDVEAAAMELAKGIYMARLRDPALQSEEVPNVWKGSYGSSSGSKGEFAAETLVTPNVMRLLRPWMAYKL